MASIRCEHLTFDFSVKTSGELDPTRNTAISHLGSANTTTATPGASAVVYGPAAKPLTVLVRSIGGQAYVTKGQGTPVATPANSTLIDAGSYAVIRLDAGDSIAALAATVS